MNTLGLITKDTITSETISSLLFDDFPSKVINVNDTRQISLGKSPNNFYINFDESLDLLDSSLGFDSETINSIPFDNPKFLNIYYRKKEVAIKVATIISQIIPELWIYDDEDGEVYSIKEYLSK